MIADTKVTNTRNINQNAIRVMIVDDSAVIRGFIRRILEEDVSIDVVASAGDGAQAVNELRRQGNIDVIVLDVEMPVMDGLAALRELIAIDCTIQIIMASTLTQRNAEISIRALEYGAADYIPKPSTQHLTSNNDFRRDLIQKVRILGFSRRRRHRTALKSMPSPRTPVTGNAQEIAKKLSSAASSLIVRDDARFRPEILVIGSSTGGPQALVKLFRQLPYGCIRQPILIAQHMPATFTTILADHIQRHSGWPCAEAINGERLMPARIYVAPGDYHLLVDGPQSSARLRLTQGAHENFCRPAVDPLLRSVVDVFNGRALAIILTGMGSDGCKGSRALVEAGGLILAQDEETSVVWGMPGAVATAGLCSAIQPPPDLAHTVIALASRPS